MAALTLAVAAVALLVYVLWKFFTASRSQRVPAGLKKLPGPKGMYDCVHFVRRGCRTYDEKTSY
jgi:hypothetical protein